MSSRLEEKRDEKIYKAADFFMLRVPTLSLNKYYELVGKDIKHLFKNKLIREAILVSSKSLYDSLENSTNYSQQVVSSFLKYYIRMTTRTTPFGLFAGIDIGSFSGCTNIEINNYSKHKKRARVDMKWLLKLIKDIEMDREILLNLKIKSNSTLLNKGNRIDNLFLSYYGQKFESVDNRHSTISIKFTKVVKYTLDKCKDYIIMKDLISTITSNVDISYEIVLNFIIDLINKEFLITELRPPLTNSSPLDYLINRINFIDKDYIILNNLIDIKNKICFYNDLELGEGENLYKEIIEKMKLLTESSHYLQVDLNISTKNCLMNENIAKDIEGFSELLAKLSVVKTKSKHLVDYKNKFLERYGEYREVPFLEMIDIDRGIGFPNTYNKIISGNDLYNDEVGENEKKFQNYIYEKISEVMKTGDLEINITDEDINSLELDNFDINKISNSFELNIFISAKSQRDIDEGRYKLIIGPNIGSTKAGKTFGRFMDMFNNEINSKIFKIIDQEKYVVNDRNTINTELACLSENARSLNVSLTKSNMEYELAIGTNSEKTDVLELKDVFVGIEDDEFYLKSRKFDKKIQLTTNHMLNHTICNNIYRLLIEMSMLKNPFSMINIISLIMEKFVYIPRIVYKNIVVMPCTWKINFKILKLGNKSDYIEFKEKFLQFREKYCIDQFVYLTYLDNRLLLDLNDDLQLKELFISISKNKTSYIRINEIEGDMNNQFIRYGKEAYFSELVVPLVKNIKNREKIIREKNKTNQYSTYNNDRVSLPFSKWLYLKLYGNKLRDNELISNNINKFVTNLLSKNLIRKFFFIRYADPEQHLRLRVLKEKGISDEINVEINKFLNNLYEQALISRVSVDTYEKEIERYGGLEVIDYAENLFYKDSLVAINIINLIETKNIDLDIKLIGVIDIIKFLEDYGIEFDDQLQLLNKAVNKDEFRESFSKHRKQLLYLANSNNNWMNLRNSLYGEILLEIFSIRTNEIKKYSKKIKKSEEDYILTNAEENIIFSVIHMICNRLYGIDRVMERNVLALTRHTLYALKFFKKNNNKDM